MTNLLTTQIKPQKTKLDDNPDDGTADNNPDYNLYDNPKLVVMG
jgi:hypothetical protein